MEPAPLTLEHRMLSQPVAFLLSDALTSAAVAQNQAGSVSEIEDYVKKAIADLQALGIPTCATVLVSDAAGNKVSCAGEYVLAPRPEIMLRAWLGIRGGSVVWGLRVGGHAAGAGA